MKSEYLTRQEVAYELDIGYETMAKWLIDGKLKTRKNHNGSKIFKDSDIKKIKKEVEALHSILGDAGKCSDG